MIKRLLSFLLFSSIFIAICAVGLCIETNILLGLPLNNFSFYCFVFGATLVQYNLHYLMKKTAIPNSERLLWSQKNRNVHVIFSFTGVLLILFSFLFFHLEHFMVLAILGGIAALYSFPLLPFGRKRRIKDYGVLKIITLALLWTLVTVWFPANRWQSDNVLFFLIFAKRFVFMLILCLMFDVRDMEIDSKEHIRTLAVILGKKKSYLLSYLLLLVFVGLAFVRYFYFPQVNFLIAMIISAIATLVIIEMTKKCNSDYIYLAGIDGMMLLQPVLIYLFSF